MKKPAKASVANCSPAPLIASKPSTGQLMKICITGANSSVGRNLLRHVGAAPDLAAVAVVRSAAAFATLPTGANLMPVAAGYNDVPALARAFAGVDSVIHLAGVLFVGKGSSYQSANVDTTAAVVAAAQLAGVRHLVFISVLGADPASANPFFRSKGEAEQLVLASGLAATVIRTPILLDPDSAGGQALLREARSGTAKVLGGGKHQVRPLDVDDLSCAMLQVCRRTDGVAAVHELTGPELVSYRDLVQLMAERLGLAVRVAAIPVWLAKLLAGISHALKGTGMSPAIIDVITMSETVTANADQALGITLTPLGATLAKIAGKESGRG